MIGIKHGHLQKLLLRGLNEVFLARRRRKSMDIACHP